MEDFKVNTFSDHINEARKLKQFIILFVSPIQHFEDDMWRKFIKKMPAMTGSFETKWTGREVGIRINRSFKTKDEALTFIETIEEVNLRRIYPPSYSWLVVDGNKGKVVHQSNDQIGRPGRMEINKGSIDVTDVEHEYYEQTEDGRSTGKFTKYKVDKNKYK